MAEAVDKKDADPTLELLQRFKRPALVVGMVLIVGRQVPRLLSGNAFVAVSAGLVIVFWASFYVVVFRRSFHETADPAAIRRRARTQALFWSAWLTVGVGWLIVGFSLDQLRDRALLVLALPAFSLSLSIFLHVKADSIARRVAARRETYGG